MGQTWRVTSTVSSTSRISFPSRSQARSVFGQKPTAICTSTTIASSAAPKWEAARHVNKLHSPIRPSNSGRRCARHGDVAFTPRGGEAVWPRRPQQRDEHLFGVLLSALGRG